MPKGLRRYFGGGDCHFISCSCYRRQPLLGTRQRRDLFLQILEQVRRRYQAAKSRSTRVSNRETRGTHGREAANRIKANSPQTWATRLPTKSKLIRKQTRATRRRITCSYMPLAVVRLG